MEPSLPEATSTTDKQDFGSSILLIVVVVLAVVFFASGLLHLLLRRLLREPPHREQDDEDDNATAMQGRLQQLFRLHDSGVDQSFIDALPVFSYGAIVVGPGGGGEPFDCAVCLCEFGPHDRLRLLTACGHAFHVGCIDTWLLAHSTCPLCRTSLLHRTPPRHSSRLSLASSSVSTLPLGEDDDDVDDKLVLEEEGKEEEEVVEVRLGKFRRNADDGGGGGVDRSDQRRCFSMGSYEYVMNEPSSSLRVAVRPPPSKRRQLLATSECGGDCHSKRQLGFLKLGFDVHESSSSRKRSLAGGGKRESFSVSKIWQLRREPRPTAAATTNGAESSRRAVSFRLPPPLSSSHEPEASAKDGGESETEAGSCCSNSAVSMESQIGETPSFARRTLQWIVSKNNRVGSHVV